MRGAWAAGVRGVCAAAAGARACADGRGYGPPAAGLAGEVLGRLAEAPQEVVELALHVAGRVDPVEQRLGALDDPVGQVGDQLHALGDEVVRTAARVVDDPVALGLRLAPDQLGFTLGVAQQAGGLRPRRR